MLFRRQFVHICGMICIHQQLQPTVSNHLVLAKGFTWGVYIHFTQVSIGSFSHKKFSGLLTSAEGLQNEKIVCQYHDSSKQVGERG